MAVTRGVVGVTGHVIKMRRLLHWKLCQTNANICSLKFIDQSSDYLLIYCVKHGNEDWNEIYCCCNIDSHKRLAQHEIKLK